MGLKQVGCFCNQFCDVLDIDVLFSLGVFHAIGHHGVAKGTTCGHHFGPGGQHIVCAFVVDFAVSFFCILEHLCAASAAAQSVLFAPSHFDQVGVQCLKGRAGGIVFSISTAQVTGVVKRDAPALERISI